MSEKIDPRAVLVHLNELGYTDIDAQQLKEFIKDLKKVIKFDTSCTEQPKSPIRTLSAGENKENRHSKHIAVHVYNKPRTCCACQESPQVPRNTNKPAPSKGKTTLLRPLMPQSNINKSDPVALYHFYQSEWKKTKIPGQDARDELRWAIRARMLEGPKVEVRAKSSQTRRSPWSR